MQNRYTHTKIARVLMRLDEAGVLADTLVARHSSRSVPTLLDLPGVRRPNEPLRPCERRRHRDRPARRALRFCSEVSCDPLTIGHEAGASCDETKNTFCDLYAGLICEAGTCVPPGDGTEGAACGDTDVLELTTCDSGLHCDPGATIDEGTCQPLLDGGDPCESGGECASGTCDTTRASDYCDGQPRFHFRDASRVA